MFAALSQVPGLLPTFTTKKALIIVNLQNDSLYAKGDLYITKNHEFVDRVKALVPRFRRIGEIIWVRTEMGTRSSPTSPGSAYIEEEVAKIDQKNREDQKLAEEKLEDDTKVTSPDVTTDEETKSQQASLEAVGPSPSSRSSSSAATKNTVALQTYHPTSRSQAMMKRASAKARAEQRTANMDVFNDKNDIFVEHVKPRKGQQPKFYIGGTPGAEIADQLKSVVDESRDMIITKHHYSAFDRTSLLMSLRMNLVTDIYLCGCLTNVGVYATAADAVQHGLSVTVVEDCLGYRSEEKHEDAMRQMADIMGVNGIDSEEIFEETCLPPDCEELIFTGPGPDGIIGLDQLSIHVPSPGSGVVELATTAGSTTTEPATAEYLPADLLPAEPLPAELAPKTPDPVITLMPDAEEPASPMTKHAESIVIGLAPPPMSPLLVEPVNQAKQASPTTEMIECQVTQRSTPLPDGFTPLPSPGSSTGLNRDSWISNSTSPLISADNLGSGDSRIIHDVLSSALADDGFALLRKEVEWQTMHHRSGKVPRLVAVQGEIEKDGSMPLYRHPADESPRLRAFSTTIEKIRKEIEALLSQPFNHALIQLYRDGNDNISEHADKTLDIVRGSSIVNVSLGAQRVMTLRTKKSSGGQGSDVLSAPRQVQRTPMPHNSVFVLGPRTNLHWLHGVRADKRPHQQKSDEEKSFGGERISITFRQIGTFINSSQKKIWGSGAKQKPKASAGDVSRDDDAEMEAMIIAFGKENHQPEFDWDKEYGSGFDVINLVSEKTKLTLCDDKVANLRVRISLSEKRVAYVLTERLVVPPPHPQQEARATRYKFHPWTHGLSNTQKPVFRDIDEDSSEVDGDLAILFYLEKFYPFPDPEGASARQLHRASALIFTRASKSNELLFWWRELQALTAPTESSSISSFPSSSFAVSISENRNQHGGTPPVTTATTTAGRSGETRTTRPVTPPDVNLVEEFQKDLDTWEGYAAESEYIAGDFWTIIDCAFWPVLDDIISGWDKFDNDRYPKLLAYHHRVYDRESVRKILDGNAV